MGSSFGLSSFLGSGSLSLARFSVDAVGCNAPKVTGPPVEFPNEKAVLPLDGAPKERIGFAGSAVGALSDFGTAWIVVLPNPKSVGFEAGS